jgi:hypothetical protein
MRTFFLLCLPLVPCFGAHAAEPAPAARTAAGPTTPTTPAQLPAGDHTLVFEAPPAWGAIQAQPPGAVDGAWPGDTVLSRAGFAGVPGLVVEVHRYDAQQVDDPGVADGDIGVTRTDKLASVQAFESLYSTRSVAPILKREATGDPALGSVDVLAPQALFWGPVDTFLLVHAAEPIANRSADLRGALVFGTRGQDYGFEPALSAWIGAPSSRIVVTVQAPVADRPELAALGAWPGNLAAGNAYLVDVLRRRRADGIGALVSQVEAFAGSLVLR